MTNLEFTLITCSLISISVWWFGLVFPFQWAVILSFFGALLSVIVGLGGALYLTLGSFQ